MEIKQVIPKISIIVPVYKVEQYLRRCLDSIVVQTFTKWECILIDDGSPDNSGIICDEYATKDTRFRVIHQKNTGVSSARNAGLDVARGEWIAWIDSDDWVETDFLITLLNTAENNKVDIVTCDYYRNKVFYDGSIGNTTPEAISNIVSGKALAFLWIKFFRADIFKKKNIRCRTEFDVTEDVVLCIEYLLNSTKLIHVHKPLYHYNIENDNSLTYSLSEEKVEQIIVATKVIDSLLSENENYFNAIRIRKSISKIWILQKSVNIQMKYIELYKTDKLSKIRCITWKRKLVLFLCEHNFIFLLEIIMRKRITK